MHTSYQRSKSGVVLFINLDSMGFSSIYQIIAVDLFKRLAFLSCFLLFFTIGFSQSIFTSTLNSTGGTKKLPATHPQFPNYFFEWSVGESSIVTTNLSGNFYAVNHRFLTTTVLTNSLAFYIGSNIKLVTYLCNPCSVKEFNNILV